MDATIADSGSKADLYNYFKAVFRLIQAQFKQIFMILFYSWWNMGTLLHTRSEKTVWTVDFF